MSVRKYAHEPVDFERVPQVIVCHCVVITGACLQYGNKCLLSENAPSDLCSPSQGLTLIVVRAYWKEKNRVLVILNGT